MGWDIKKYSEVKDRIPLFWEKFPNGAIVTELVSDELLEFSEAGDEEGVMETMRIAKVVFKAILYADRNDITAKPLATGYAMETDESSKIDKYFENTETSAIGRALANGGFSATPNEPRPSKEEMESAERAKDTNRKVFKKNR